MLAKLATTTVLAATAAQAFLLPPGVSDSDLHIADVAAVVAPSSAESQLVKLDCPGCPLTIHGPRGTRVIPDKPNHLELTFSVDHQADGDRLLLNGFELHPNPIPGVLTAPQVPDWKKTWHGPFAAWHHADKKDHGHHGLPPFLTIEPPPLGFAMQTNPSSARDPDSQLELVTIDFQVVEVANTFIAGIPELHVKLIKDASGRLMIGNIEQSVPESKTADSESPKCNNLLCKWLETIFPKGPARPCHGKKPAPVTASAPAGDDDRLGPGMRHDHSWGKLFRNIASHILLPVLIGIVAGVSISVIGMAVGTVVVSLWRTFVRRPTHHHRHHRRRSSHHHKAPRKEAAVDEEKSGLMEHQDPPPSYEAEPETLPTAEIDDTKKGDQQV